METLPLEMVLKISSYLNPKDLARCSGVCLDWYEIFNADCHWKPHCDPELAEHLRNTPSVVEPVFVTREAINNMLLTPVGHWRLAYMREKHLYRNLRLGNYKKEEVVRIKSEIERDFLTNTHVVRWCLDRIEIWDISVTPIVFVAKTDPSVDLRGSLYHFVISSSVLLVEQTAQIKVFHVDALNKHVELRHDITLNEARLAHGQKGVVKDNIYVRVNPKGLSLDIIDLEAGELKRNEPCPSMGNGNAEATISEIKGSPTSDIVVVLVYIPDNPSSLQYHYYDLRQLTFFQGPYDKPWSDRFPIALHEHYLLSVFNNCGKARVYNCRTHELIYRPNKTANVRMACVLNNCFLFLLSNNKGENLLKMFSPTDRKVTSVCIMQSKSEGISLEKINNEMLCCRNNENVVKVLWKASEGTMKRCDFLVRHDLRYNQPLTRAMLKDLRPKCMLSIYHYW